MHRHSSCKRRVDGDDVSETIESVRVACLFGFASCAVMSAVWFGVLGPTREDEVRRSMRGVM